MHRCRRAPDIHLHPVRRTSTPILPSIRKGRDDRPYTYATDLDLVGKTWCSSMTLSSGTCRLVTLHSSTLDTVKCTVPVTCRDLFLFVRIRTDSETMKPKKVLHVDLMEDYLLGFGLIGLWYLEGSTG